MRLAKQVTADGTVFDKMENSAQHTNGILLKHISGTVNYGSIGQTAIPLTAGLAPVLLPTTDTKSLELSGGGVVAVGLF